jgi:hypothetical protein
VYPCKRGVWGCGIVLANMTSEEAAVCMELGKALERIYADHVVADNEPQNIGFRVIKR